MASIDLVSPTDVFDYLIFSAIIDGTVLCVHGVAAISFVHTDSFRVAMYILCFMCFILALKKIYKYQFGQYVWGHMILIVVFSLFSFLFYKSISLANMPGDMAWRVHSLRYASKRFIDCYARIAKDINKSIWDIALRCKWMRGSSCYFSFLCPVFPFNLFSILNFLLEKKPFLKG